MKTKKIVTYTPMIYWYLQHGFKITPVYQLVEYQQDKPFSLVPEGAVNPRCEANKNPLK